MLLERTSDVPLPKRSRPAGDGPASCFWGGGAAMRYVARRSVRGAPERALNSWSKISKVLAVCVKAPLRLTSEGALLDQCQQPPGDRNVDRLADRLGDVEPDVVQQRERSGRHAGA